MRTSSNTKARNNLLFRKYLNGGYPRTIIYSVLNAFDDIFTH